MLFAAALPYIEQQRGCSTSDQCKTSCAPRDSHNTAAVMLSMQLSYACLCVQQLLMLQQREATEACTCIQPAVLAAKNVLPCIGLPKASVDPDAST
jgi:hypothetical protein